MLELFLGFDLLMLVWVLLLFFDAALELLSLLEFTGVALNHFLVLCLLLLFLNLMLHTNHLEMLLLRLMRR